jgi:hypothetical protein
MEAILTLSRRWFSSKSSQGELYLNGKFFCYTMEDIVRPTGVKVDGKTAIPYGTYKVSLSLSNRFKRILPMVYTESDGFTLKADGKSFKGIRIHGGNTSENSEGCILVAFKKLNVDTIQGTAEKKLTEELKKYSKITLNVIQYKEDTK